MTTEVIVAVILVIGSVATATVTYFLTKKEQRETEWRDAKLNHY